MTATEDELDRLGDELEPDLPEGFEPEDMPPPEIPAEFASLEDGTGLFSSPGETAPYMGEPDDGEVAHRVKPSILRGSRRNRATGDLLNAGHGFLIRTYETPKTEQATDCEVCGRLLLPAADEWFCESVGPDGEHVPASSTCRCNWCLHYQQWLRGEYRPKGGRPAKRCGLSDCERLAARHRQRKSRAARKARRCVTETPQLVGG